MVWCSFIKINKRFFFYKSFPDIKSSRLRYIDLEFLTFGITDISGYIVRLQGFKFNRVQ